MKEKEKLIKRIKEQVDIMTSTLRFNEVHIDGYIDSRGKTKYRGKVRVHDVSFSFSDLSLYDVDNIFDGILTGYVFAVEQLNNGTKK